jgi:hypothetical protein
MLENPKALDTNFSENSRDETMDNQQETKVINHITSRILRDYA